MRGWFAPLLIGVMLAGTLAAGEWRRRADRDADTRLRRATEARLAIERQVRIRSATGGAARNERGWPETIDPGWFEGGPPRNPLVGAGHPWVEVAGPDQADLVHPRVRQALTPTDAEFWYNPARGVVRARVGPAATDAAAIDLYNRVNGTAVSSLFASGTAAQPGRGEPRRAGTTR